MSVKIRMKLWGVSAIAIALLTSCSGGDEDNAASNATDVVVTTDASISSASAEITTPETTVAPTTPPTTTVTPTTPPTTTAPETGTRDNPIQLGTTAEVGEGWSVTINSVDLNAAEAIAATEVNWPASDGKQYVLVNITAAYNGTEASSTGGVSISAIGQGTNVAIGEFGAANFVIPPKPVYDQSAEVFQGGEVTGNIVLEVPAEDIDTLVLIGEALFLFDDDQRKFFATTDIPVPVGSNASAESAAPTTASAPGTTSPPTGEIEESRAATAGQNLVDAGLCADLRPAPVDESGFDFGVEIVAELECDSDVGLAEIMELPNDTATKALATIFIELAEAFDTEVEPSQVMILDVGEGLLVAVESSGTPSEKQLSAVTSWLNEAKGELGGEITPLTDLVK